MWFSEHKLLLVALHLFSILSSLPSLRLDVDVCWNPTAIAVTPLFLPHFFFLLLEKRKEKMVDVHGTIRVESELSEKRYRSQGEIEREMKSKKKECLSWILRKEGIRYGMDTNNADRAKKWMMWLIHSSHLSCGCTLSRPCLLTCCSLAVCLMMGKHAYRSPPNAALHLHAFPRRQVIVKLSLDSISR